MKRSTENKNSIGIIKMRQAYLEAVLESAPDAIVTLDAESNITGWNKSAERLFGYTSVEAMGKNVDDLIANGDSTVHKEAVGFSKHVSNKKPVGPIETVRYHKDGAPLHVILAGSPVSVNDVFEGSVAVYTDITERKKTEQALRESESKMRSIFKASPTGIGLVVDRMLMDVNEKICEMLGYSQEELIGKNARILYPTDEEYEYVGREKYAQIQERGSGTVETRWERKGGKIINVLLSSTPLDPADLSAGVTFTALDITDRKRAEEALKESETRFATIFKANPAAVAITRLADNVLIDVNEAWQELTGYMREEAFGYTAIELNLWANPEQRKQLVEMLHEQDKARGEIKLRRKSSEIRELLMSAEMIELTGDRYLLTMAQDITERRQMEELLKQERDQAQQYLDIASVMILALNANGEITLINKKGCELLEYEDQAELLGRNWFDMCLPKGVKDEVWSVFRELMAGDIEPVEYHENPVMTKTGVKRIIAFHNTVLRDSTSNITGILSSGEDITERKRAEEALKESHERLLTILDGIDADVYVSDIESYEILFMNRHMQDNFGESLVGKVCWQVFRGESKPCPHCTNEKLLDANGEPARVISWEGQNPLTGKWYINYDRAIKWVDNRIVRLQVATDITERVQAEEALRQSEARYRTLFENANDAIFLENEEDEIIDVNRQACEMMGYTREELLQMTVPELQAPEVRGVKGTVIKQELEKYRGNLFETQNLHCDGTRFPVEVSTASIPGQDAGLALAIVRDITERKRAEGEIRGYIKHIETLLEIGKVVSSTLDLDEVLHIIMTELRKVTPYDSISLQTLRDKALEILACRGFDQPGEVVGLIFPLDPKFPNQRVVEENKTLAIEDVVQEYPHFRDESSKYKSEYIRSWLGVPLVSKGEVIGMIALDRSEVIPFSETEIQLATAVASHAVLAIENARLFGESQRRLEFLSSLRQIDRVITSSLDLRVTLDILLRQVLRQLGVDAAAVLLYQAELQSLEFVAGQGFRTQALQFTDLRLGEGFAGRAALEQHVIQVYDLNSMQTGFLRSPEFRSEGFVAYIGVPLIAKGNIIGVLEIYHRQSLDHDREWMTFLETLAGQAAIAIDNIRLFEDLQTSNLQLRQAYDATIEGWALALEMRDRETEGHSRRVVDWTLELARKLRIEEKQLVHIRRGALLHDIGKMGIPDSILQKPDKLTEEEWNIIQQHPVYAYQWLASILYLQASLDIPYCHHEKWNGTGYPRGLKGEQIPLAARIFAVVDVWDALLSDRSYRKAWSQDEVLAYLNEQSGQHFDPRIVDAFIDLLSEKGYLGQSLENGKPARPG